MLISPVSAKAAKGTACLSLLSDSSATATWPLIRSSWLGRWMDWQTDANTPPIRLQSSSLVQSCGRGKTTRWRQGHLTSNRRVPRANLDFHHSVGHIQVSQTGARGGSSLTTDRISQSQGFWPWPLLGLNQLHLLARISVCADGGLNVTIVWKTVHPVKAEHQTGGSHLGADRHTVTCTDLPQNSCVLASGYLECELHELRQETGVTLFSHKIEESQHKLVARLGRQKPELV